jgi:hypothetical protein
VSEWGKSWRWRRRCVFTTHPQDAPVAAVTLVRGAFFVEVTGMNRSRTHKLNRSSELVAIPETVDSFTGDVEYSFPDQSPSAGKASYRLEVAP